MAVLGNGKRSRFVLAAVAWILAVVALPAFAHHGPPYPSGPDHDHGEMVDYPLYFPSASATFSDSFYSGRCCDPGEIHHAQDLMGPKMTPVYAAASGTVRSVNWSHDPDNIDLTRCCTLAIRHDDGWETWYIHLNNDTPGTDDGQGWGVAEGILPGTRVSAGQLIGWVGDSGNAENTSPHLHFELIDPNGVRVNPYQTLKTSQANGGMPECNGVTATIFGDADGDGIIQGTSGNDVIVGTGDDDIIRAGGGHDIVCGWEGDDEIDGGPGNDTLDGGPGEDDLYGRGGNDTIEGGSDRDRMFGNGGKDILIGRDTDVLRGGRGRDVLQSVTGSNNVAGNKGKDTLDYSARPSAVVAQPGNGANTDSLTDYPEILLGSPWNDVLGAAPTSAMVKGQGGHDVITGSTAADRLFGNGGDDLLNGADGDDQLIGGGGTDTGDGGDGEDTCIVENPTLCEG